MFDTYTENQEQGGKSARTLIIGLATAAIIVCVLVAAFFVLRSDPYEDAANQLRLGMSKSEVAQKVGEPSGILGYAGGIPVLFSYKVGGDGPPLLVVFDTDGRGSLNQILIPDKEDKPHS